ncbi:MAG TPA: hypothetical protein VEX13_16890 [Chloroflexia bacterium]|nr:hypothetical protein [Chloroflexia bacterium]
MLLGCTAVGLVHTLILPLDDRAAQVEMAQTGKNVIIYDLGPGIDRLLVVYDFKVRGEIYRENWPVYGRP